MKKVINQAGTRPVPAQLRHVHRGALAAATSLTPVTEGGGIGTGRFRIKARPHGVFAIFDESGYVVTTGTKKEEDADKVLKLHEMQAEARAEGLLDVRHAPANEVMDDFEAVEGRRSGTQKSIERAFNRLRPFIGDKLVRELNAKWLKETMKALKTAPHNRLGKDGKPSGFGYAEASRVLSFAWLSVAILNWCENNGAPKCLPFKRPGQPKGRTMIFTAEQQATILRWSRGDEDYDPETGTWSPPALPLTDKEIHERRMVERMAVMGFATGSRPGGIWGLARVASTECPYIVGGTLHRLPLGVPQPVNKLSPSVQLCAEAMIHVRRWEAEDGPGQRWILRRWADGGPLNQDSCSRRWRKAMEGLGIAGRRHACRHTIVTGLVARNVHPLIISAVAGMSLRTIKVKYNHSPDSVLQPMAFPQIDALLRDGIGAGPTATA